MTAILQFKSDHGVISVEIDDRVAEVAGAAAPPALVAKGSAPMATKGTTDILVDATSTFEDAMSTLKAYASSLEKMIIGLDLTPKSVSVEIGLKLTAAAGFIIAKAGTEAEMKVSLTWEPTPSAKPESVV